MSADDLRNLVPLRQLGHGTLCEVLLVEDSAGRRYALKRPLPDRRTPGVLRLLADEGRVAAQLAHPNIPRLVRAFDDALLFELLDGVTLDEVLPKKTTVSGGEAAFLVGQVLDALAYVHSLPTAIIHRDVGPHNIVVTRSGDPALIDFGIAVDGERERWTATGALRGTLGYLSPEAVRGEAIDARADVFAVAALLYRLLLGRRPFVGRGARAILQAVAGGRFAAVDDPRLQGLFERGLAADPRRRFQSAQELANAVAAIVGLGAERSAASDIDTDVTDDTARRSWAARVAPLLPSSLQTRGLTLS